MLMQLQNFDGPYLERLRSGDFTTEQHFFAYFAELIRLKARKRLRTAVAVEDVQQETFARVLRGIAEHRIAQPERLGAFVNAVCNNVLREHYRSGCREIPTDDEFDVPDPTLGVGDVLCLRQMQQQVRRIVLGLPEKDRRLIQALFFEERDKDEICRDFGVDREYLRVLLYRAKQAFKTHYLTSSMPPQRSTQPRGAQAPMRVLLNWDRIPTQLGPDIQRDSTFIPE
jgi:RNA polymerase sigma-70 factor, ECF subfamily